MLSIIGIIFLLILYTFIGIYCLEVESDWWPCVNYESIYWKLIRRKLQSLSKNKPSHQLRNRGGAIQVGRERQTHQRGTQNIHRSQLHDRGVHAFSQQESGGKNRETHPQQQRAQDLRISYPRQAVG